MLNFTTIWVMPISRAKYPMPFTYERAYRQKPNDEDILFNLEFARTYTVDRIEPCRFFSYQMVPWCSKPVHINGWARIGIIFFWPAAFVAISGLRAGRSNDHLLWYISATDYHYGNDF